ncbi:MAG TPA: M20/M25/M40 family metallo-hydrolase [Gemmatimonadaceae bacterium]|jgi:acetylornithine deacetylase/succinyl-diaminopimelate desuccinylase-like protein
MRFAAGLIAAFPVALCAQAQQSALRPEQQLAHDIYKALIEINTADSVGNTTTAATAVANRFRAAGFPDADIFQGGPRPDKGNLIVRYRGNGASSRKPLMLLAHLDVVQALKSDWSPDIDPFKFTERDGYYYGRGTSDDKAMGSIFIANLLRFKQEGFVPERDILLVLTADEEGGPANGVRWLIANHRDKIDAAYALNEGGGGSLRDGKPFINSVGAAEKVSANFTVTTANRGGHSSVPRDDNAIYELSQALVNIGKYQFPVMLNEVNRAFFTNTAKIEKPEMAAAMRAIVTNPNDAKASATISADPRYRSMLRTTCVATMLNGGHARNALPQTATANVNCRMAPGHDPADVRSALLKAANDTGVKISAAPAMEHAAPSPLSPEIMKPIEKVTRDVFGPNVLVIPTMGTGATDSKYLRAAGIPGYGVSGLMGDPDDARAHGKDERVLIKSYYDSQDFLYRLVKELSSGKVVP